jgi:fructokinase
VSEVRTLVLGEALIDVVRSPDGAVAEHPGGSPANVALGLARLGHPVSLRTSIGSDERGALIAAHLEPEGVELAAGSRTDGPTSVAEATLDATGAATYRFELRWEVAPPVSVDGATHLHTGSIAATLEPGATAVLDAVERARTGATVSYDPNARPSLMGQPQDVRAKIEQIIGLSDVVKASDEDVHWLYDGAAIPEVMRLWGRLGPTVVVVTRGGEGAVVAVNGVVVSLAAPTVTVADTVGAGDSFMAGLISGLLDAGLLGGTEARAALRAAGMDQVRPAVERALACAAVTVSRAGANPPRRDEI